MKLFDRITGDNGPTRKKISASPDQIVANLQLIIDTFKDDKDIPRETINALENLKIHAKAGCLRWIPCSYEV